MIHIRHVPRFFAGAQNDCRGRQERNAGSFLWKELRDSGEDRPLPRKGAVRRIKRKNPFVHNLSTQPDCVSRPQPAEKPRPLEPFEPGPRSGPLISFYLPFAAHVENGSVGGVGQALDSPYAVLGGGVNVAVFYRYNVSGGPHGGDGGIGEKIISVFGGAGGIRGAVGGYEEHVRVCLDNKLRRCGPP